MHYTGTTYRPPYEASSLLLQVTTGCSHNSCRFCTMYRDVDFAISPMSEIKADIEEAAQKRPMTTRAFLLNGNAFCLSTEMLLEIADELHRSFEFLYSIGCYGTVNDLRDKSDDDLRKLAEAGYSEINFGLESGMESVLAYMNKGYDVGTAREQLGRLRPCGLAFSVNIINAAAGPDLLHEHARVNASIINEVRPSLVFVSPLHIDPGSELENDVATGVFKECTLGQYIEEEIELLEGIEAKGCYFYGEHVSNPIPVSGWAVDDKAFMLKRLRTLRGRIPQEYLDSHPSKGSEGRLTVRTR